jgi:hypothetical protein
MGVPQSFFRESGGLCLFPTPTLTPKAHTR